MVVEEEDLEVEERTEDVTGEVVEDAKDKEDVEKTDVVVAETGVVVAEVVEA